MALSAVSLLHQGQGRTSEGDKLPYSRQRPREQLDL